MSAIDVNEQTLQSLVTKFGPAKGIHLFNGALLLREIGWVGVLQVMTRRTAYRLRQELTEAGLVSEWYFEQQNALVKQRAV